MLLSYMWIGLGWDGMVGPLCGATIRASLRDANKEKAIVSFALYSINLSRQTLVCYPHPLWKCCE